MNKCQRIILMLMLTTVIFCAVTIHSAEAAMMRYDLTYSSYNGSGASATGYIVFDIINSSTGDFYTTGTPAIADLYLNVVGAATSGQYYLNDFDFVSWSTDGHPLNLGTNLIGQSLGLTGFTFGQLGLSGAGGDFGIFGKVDGLNNPLAPTSSDPFLLAALSGEQMYLSDMTPTPEPGTLLLLGTGIIGLLRFRRRFQKTVV